MGFRDGWGPYWRRPTREEEIEWLEEEARELRRALEEIEARLSELRSSK
jgi:ubiquinone biosynthesis protein UbiJ